eukprot:CAMPEP_0174334406 /NCGR_PEP_ID=MMETSP0810-20121108/19900_1 /TAXON_ID=73025 ORGANISM="Eutreptiella gymnastica-like, Strain CCMP1594" /NCGR_SAMPLE_ID=MMETSP0810 /ASSEMBLY_ACC=CAM_ASM_000659 /LENGTH=56 /DNA_ID=CAMNT_0015452051 /DNA_START=326 /DNA_END=492 /DNA_ORIENTATION=-
MRHGAAPQMRKPLRIGEAAPPTTAGPMVAADLPPSTPTGPCGDVETGPNRGHLHFP